MNSKEYFTRFAHYNRWANELLYGAAAALPEDRYFLDTGMFFKSIHGTLNHVLVADRIWLRRITGEGETYKRLDDVLYPDFESLKKAREEEDKRIIRLMESYSEADFEKNITYKLMDGTPRADRIFDVLPHFFNHQTHHRGQVHSALSQGGLKPPQIDLIFFIREQESKAA